VPKKANDSDVKFNSKRPLNTIENTDNNRIIDAVICAIFVDTRFKVKDLLLSVMRIKFEISPKNNEELEFIRRIIEEMQTQNILEKK